METLQGHHHLLHRQTKTSGIYLILGIVLMMPLIWSMYGREQVRAWHPFYDVEYSLYWYLTLTYLYMKGLLYLIVARLTNPKHYTLLYCFMVYESAMILDHFLVYSQSDVRKWLAIMLSTYIVWYHYKYETVR